MAYVNHTPWPTETGAMDRVTTGATSVANGVATSVATSVTMASATTIAVAEAIATPVDAGRFDALDLRVIALAERVDVTREITEQSWFGRFVERVFGWNLSRPLANPRLERLRRFASLARHHADRVDEREIDAFVAAGYTVRQAHGLLAYFSAQRARLGDPRLA